VPGGGLVEKEGWGKDLSIVGGKECAALGSVDPIRITGGKGGSLLGGKRKIVQTA